MFIITAKLRKEWLIGGAVALLAIVCAAVLTLGAFHAQGAQVSSAVSPKGVKTNEDRIAYLENYGWTVEPEAIAVEELLIPEEFDETYDQYLALQSGQGFDLTKYAGKRVKRYTYVITNYPTGEQGVQAGLLLYKDTVVGGEVLSPQLGGFIHSLEMPQ